MKQYFLPILLFLIAVPTVHAQVPAVEKLASPKIYRPLGDFSFLDETGAEVSRESMLGTVWIAQFFLINCKGPCPVITTRLATIMRKYRDELKLQAVSITVDPDNDTPERLATYKQVLNAEPDRWHFVRGERESLGKILSKSFHVPDSDNPQAHTTNLVLIDAKGQIRGYYSGIRTEEFERMEREIYSVLNEREPVTQNQ